MNQKSRNETAINGPLTVSAQRRLATNSGSLPNLPPTLQNNLNEFLLKENKQKLDLIHNSGKVYVHDIEVKVTNLHNLN